MSNTRKYTEEEKRQILDEVESTGKVAIVAAKNNIPVSTIHCWIKPKYPKKTKAEKDLKVLKTKIADMALENKILRELLKKTYEVWDRE